MSLGKGVKFGATLLGIAALFLAFSFLFLNRDVNTESSNLALEPVEIPGRAAIPNTTVAFDSTASGNSEIYTMSPDDVEPRPITADPAFDSWRPRISPDRRTILFQRSPAGVYDADPESVSLWMVAAVGGEPIEVLPVGAHGWDLQGGAEWSPTGEQLIMTGGTSRERSIWVTSADGRFVRRVDTGDGESFDPAWSPDGTRAVFIACPAKNCDPTEREIFVVMVSGGDRLQLTNDELEDAQPSFSPDGMHIAMRSRTLPPTEDGTGGVWDIRVVAITGRSDPRVLVGDTSSSSSPQWMDNATIIFDRVVAGADTRSIYTAARTGGEVDEWRATPANEGHPTK